MTDRTDRQTDDREVIP